MARPVLRLKTRDALARPEGAEACPKCEGWLAYRIQSDTHGCVKCDYTAPVEAETPKSEHPYPESWIKGQLLNLRRSGEMYLLSLLGEEYDAEHPERGLYFNNSYDCQQFTSWWYARDNHDPRAG